MISIGTLSGRGSEIIYEKKVNGYHIMWSKTPFILLNSEVEDVLHNYFKEDLWYPLGASMDNPTKSGLGEYLDNNYGKYTPRHASAIASVLVNENFLMNKGKRPIYMRRITEKY